MSELNIPEKLNAATVFVDRHIEEGRSDKPAILCEERVITYRQLHENVNRFGNVLRDLGVRIEERIAMLLPDIPEFGFTFFGTMKIGAVAVPLNTLLDSVEYAHLLQDSRARVLVVHASLVDAVVPILSELTYLEHVLVCGDDSTEYPSLEGLLAGASAELEAVETGRHDVAFWLYSSGTTGLPKGIIHRHQDMIVTSERYAVQALGLTGSDISFSVPKLFFAYGLGNSLYFPLWTGGTAVLLPGAPTPEAVFNIIDRHQPSVFYSVPTNFTVLLQAAERDGRTSLGDVRMCLSAAEPLPKPLFEQWQARFGLELLEGIGSTEALHIFISNRAGSAKVGSTGQLVPGYEAKIVDDEGEELPVGERGTLLIKGESITLGYWNNPDKTQATLLGEWCNTRDTFKVDEDGFFYYVGREDDLMKIGGQWVSPKDIESVLQEHPAVLETGVVGSADEGIITPVAYVSVKDGYSPSADLALELQEFVRANSARNHACWIEFIDELPQTTVGKIQRSNLRALNELRGEHKNQVGSFVDELAQFSSPQAQRDHLLSYIRTQVAVALRLDESQLQDAHISFFELGMDSLAAVALRNRLQTGLGRAVSSAALFKHATLTALTSHVFEQVLASEGTAKTAEPALSDALPQLIPSAQDRSKPFPLTDIQLAYIFGRGDTFLGNVATHWYTEIDCDYDDAALARFNAGWQRLIQRQDMLRAVMLPDGRQQILEDVPPYNIEVSNLINQPAALVERELMATRDKMSHQILDPYTWPIFEIKATRLESNRTRLHVGLDLLIMDAWSMFLIFRELHDIIYQPHKLEPLEINFRDYVLAEEAFKETAHYQKAKDYWFARLDNLPPTPDLPFAIKPEALKSHEFTHRGITVPADTWQTLQARAAKVNLTPSALLLSVFAEVLAIWSKNAHFVINITLFTRQPLHRQINDVVGDFTSLLLLEVDHTIEEPFIARAQRIQQQLMDDLDHNAIHGVQVLRELARRQGGNQRAAMPVVFSSTLGLGSLGSDMSSVSQFGDIAYTVSQTPQVWLDYQVFENKGELILNWDCIEELFPEGLIDDMLSAYSTMLSSLANDEATWQQSKFQPLLMEKQLTERTSINDTSGDVSNALLHELFIARAKTNPDAPAVISHDHSVSYGKLLDLATRTAHWLQRHDVAPNTLVAVVMEKGWEQIAAVLGVLMSGGAYLPIDAHQPEARINTILADGQVTLALTQPQFEHQALSAGITRLTITEDNLAQEQAQLTPVAIGPEDLAYVIYTSGSTGKPKGTMLPHRGPVNTILDVNRKFAVTENDRAICLSALNFDLSVYDVFGVLAAGGALVMPDQQRLRDPAHWRALMIEHKVTVWNTVPALQQMLVDYLEPRNELVPPDMRLVMMSGDWIPVDLPNRIRALWPDMMVVGLGGPTETSIWNNHYVIEDVDPNWQSIPYGKPLANQTLHVLNQDLAPCPVWVTGDLYVGGRGLGKGFWQDEEKTNALFIVHPQSGEKLYKSGDLARYLPDGNLEIMGRADFQVKIRGHRIELKEIEAILADHGDIRSAVVTAFGESHNLQSLAAYVVLQGDKVLSEEAQSDLIKALKAHVAGLLPEYMVPTTITVLDALPLSANGKVDRKALPAPDLSQSLESDTQTLPETELEQTLAEIWCALLNRTHIGIYDSFFDVGGDSASIVQLHAKLWEALGQEVPITKLFEHPTIHALAAHLEGEDVVEHAARSNRVDKRRTSRKSAKDQRQARRRSRAENS
ncbi:benzoate-CoA ligase family protein [Pseudoalteromonas luteoviolacea]|uniref:benzoate-CoA ligase family protein n=1 Tax=Pseudoalteromonas luteoviolacea TaxID=43657 RepID=UPI001B3A23E2|nr:benzoate-CoA ligase family protein [Pseudoalteromonas luteoviolacea]MBQ4877998.1 benzoate-CoA ligase family protein [Pseudoalteromonas luteoviolacea]MBQ4907148.1 benzoate-CoA ligase family protein [Pseudoalteromonas luteoviolacea]